MLTLVAAAAATAAAATSSDAPVAVSATAAAATSSVAPVAVSATAVDPAVSATAVRATATLVSASNRVAAPPAKAAERPRRRSRASDVIRRPDSACVAWRQSTFCRWDGPREEAADEPCNATISTGRSGYCHCRRHRHVARFDCGHPPLRCDQACAVLEDAPTVRALAYTALMAFDDRAAALSLAFGGGRRRRDASQRPPARPSSRSDAAGGAGRIPVTLYQTIDKLDRPGIGLRWEESEPLGLRRVLHDDVLGQQYLNASWGPRFARAYGQISLGPIRGLANESVIDGFHASMKLGQISLGPIRGDFLRLAYIAEHGGFYADADVCPVHNSTLSRLAASGAPLVIVASMFSGELLNAFFGAVPPRPAAPRDGTSGEERQGRCIRRRAAPPRPATSGVGGAVPRRGGRARVRPARRHRRRRPAAGGIGAHRFPFGC